MANHPNIFPPPPSTFDASEAGYKMRISFLEGILTQRTKENEDLHNRVGKLEAKKDDLEHLNKEFAAKLREERKRNENVEKYSKQLEDANTTMELSLKACQGRLAEMNAPMDTKKLDRQIDLAATSIVSDDRQPGKTKLAKENKKLQEELQSLIRHNESLVVDLTELDRNVLSLQSENESLTANKISLEDQLSELQATIPPKPILTISGIQTIEIAPEAPSIPPIPALTLSNIHTVAQTVPVASPEPPKLELSLSSVSTVFEATPVSPVIAALPSYTEATTQTDAPSIVDLGTQTDALPISVSVSISTQTVTTPTSSTATQTTSPAVHLADSTVVYINISTPWTISQILWSLFLFVFVILLWNFTAIFGLTTRGDRGAWREL